MDRIFDWDSALERVVNGPTPTDRAAAMQELIDLAHWMAMSRMAEMPRGTYDSRDIAARALDAVVEKVRTGVVEFPSPAEAKAYLRNAVVRKVIDRKRQVSPRPRVEPGEVSDTHSEWIEAGEASGSSETGIEFENLSEYMSRLAERDRRALESWATGGYAHVACVLNISPTNSRQIVHRALCRLRELVEGPQQ